MANVECRTTTGRKVWVNELGPWVRDRDPDDLPAGKYLLLLDAGRNRKEPQVGVVFDDDYLEGNGLGMWDEGDDQVKFLMGLSPVHEAALVATIQGLDFIEVNLTQSA